MNPSSPDLKTWMTLGRVSNLPTVWTNTLAAALLASIPTLFVYVVMGKFFMRGLLAGALKG